MNLSRRERHVLDLLEAGEATGLELIRRSEAVTRWWSPRRLRRGTVYVLLAHMEERGLVGHADIRDISARELAGLDRPRRDFAELNFGFRRVYFAAPPPARALRWDKPSTSWRKPCPES